MVQSVVQCTILSAALRKGELSGSHLVQRDNFLRTNDRDRDFTHTVQQIVFLRLGELSSKHSGDAELL